MKLQADSITPVSIYEALYSGPGSFLLESPSGQGKLERYSFIGIDPVEVITDFAALQKADLKHGAFGFFSYDFGREIEKLPDLAKDDLGLPRLMFVVPKTLVVFDHLKQEVEVFSDAPASIVDRLSSWHCRSSQGWDGKHSQPPNHNPNTFLSNFTKEEFETIVRQAKEYIAAGDIYQVNLSQRFQAEIKDPPFEIYKRLRAINPSPFASYFDFGEIKLISSSPERLVKLENGIAETRPIAGTRPITAAPEELLLDPKERAEHIMLVDLERNDLGKVCEYGSVHVDENMITEKYSHVIHIVSNVKGKLRKDRNQFDLIRAMFPGGTITGCPKIRSMEIIEELEPVKRGPYTGSIGYIMRDKMDLNITIRTIVVKNKTAYIQAGAGIVDDSLPEREYHETWHKARAMLEAI
ncbi:MAG: anthranilate synthase component I family protein [Candidatus Margulisbacteria bacterium]|nr:anthranilate synthase component I family protein [Candidatus Margulisiibacteriota bacterium]